ncbi:MAG TPA: hypothetical protein PKH10_09145 [bacterium]|nr:hypothetical protein [bacterium]
MNYRRSLILAALASLAALLSACAEPQDDRVSCVTSFDCPLGWFCEDSWCVQNPDQSAGGDTKNDIDTSVDIDTATAEDDTLPDTAEGSDLNDDGVIPDEQGDDAVIVDDTDEPTVEGDALIPDDDTGATDDGTDTDTATDGDIVTDTATDADAVPPNTGATCSVAGDCVGGATCGQIFTGQTTSYCYLSCAWPNESICAGTAWPECAVISSWALCLATATVGGNFTALVDSFQQGNNISLTINGTNHIQSGCVASLSGSTWILQCSKVLESTPNTIQLDTVFYWDTGEHNTDGTVANAEGRAYQTTFVGTTNEVSERWVRAVFTVNDGTLTLTQAGTAAGSTVAGTINFTGNAYDAQLTVQ